MLTDLKTETKKQSVVNGNISICKYKGKRL